MPAPSLLRRIGQALSWAGFAALLSACSTAPPRTAADLLALRAEQIEAPITTPTARQQARQQAALLIERVDRGELTDPSSTLQALHAVAFHDMQPQAGRRILERSLQAQALAALDAQRQRELLTQAHQLDPQLAAPWIAPQLAQIATPREFAIAAHLLLSADANRYRPLVMASLAARGDGDDPRLVALAERLQPPALPAPPLEDLLGAPFQPGLPVVFSLQRDDRRHIGLLLLRGADGRFVRDADGLPLNRPHLALALSQLPGTLTNGNTPQGLFTIVGTGVAATNPWIGPTPYLHSKLPIEASPAEFAHQPDLQAEWTEARYLNLLPPSWRAHRPMREAWLAGRAGRDELLLHGTTIDASSYQQRPWYPGTPSAGCLVLLEHWDAKGRLQRSDQLTLLQAFARQSRADAPPRGYLVVVNLPDGVGPVSLAELLPAIRRAEASGAVNAPP